ALFSALILALVLSLISALILSLFLRASGFRLAVFVLPACLVIWSGGFVVRPARVVSLPGFVLVVVLGFIFIFLFLRLVLLGVIALLRVRGHPAC
ncbi:MAG TPA: hypothetical protein VIL63_06530, partial [Terriglobales bacterium]